jgi:hypothetical protein
MAGRSMHGYKFDTEARGRRSWKPKNADTLVVEKKHSRRVQALEILIALGEASYGAAWVFTHFAG